MTEQEIAESQWAMKMYRDIKDRLEILERQRCRLIDDVVEISDNEIWLYVPQHEKGRFIAGMALCADQDAQGGLP